MEGIPETERNYAAVDDFSTTDLPDTSITLQAECTPLGWVWRVLRGPIRATGDSYFSSEIECWEDARRWSVGCQLVTSDITLRWRKNNRIRNPLEGARQP
jgi:hypothetical protein